MKLCAFADEASVNLDGQIKALKRNDMTEKISKIFPTKKLLK